MEENNESPILKYNKILSEFMGFKEGNTFYIPDSFIINLYEQNFIDRRTIAWDSWQSEEEELVLFHCRFDWQLKVFKKLIKLGYKCEIKYNSEGLPDEYLTFIELGELVEWYNKYAK